MSREMSLVSRTGEATVLVHSNSSPQRCQARCYQVCQMVKFITNVPIYSQDELLGKLCVTKEVTAHQIPAFIPG